MTFRVGIDVAGARAPSTGIGRYTTALYRALAGVEDLDMVPFCNVRGAAPSLDPPGQVRNPRWPTRLLHGTWSRFGWPTVERFVGDVSVFHTSDWSHPPMRAARVTTVHDLGSLFEPAWYAPDIVEHHAHHNAATCRLSQRVIAISEYTRDTFVERYAVDPDRVVVVPHGVDPLFAPAGPAVVSEVRGRLGLDGPFLLYVGTRERRKNLTGLIDVFARVAEEFPDLSLAIVGARPWIEAQHVHGALAWSGTEVEQKIAKEGLEERVAVLGSVPLADLIALYSAAEAFVFTSLFEGFGLPVLEAMACGCPVIASATTAIPEVVGAAGLLASPQDPDAFARAVTSVVGDKDLRAELVERGQARARKFTWKRTAQATAEVYREAARAGARSG